MLRLILAQACLTLSPGWMSALYLFFFKDVLGFSIAVASGLLIVYVLAGVAGRADHHVGFVQDRQAPHADAGHLGLFDRASARSSSSSEERQHLSPPFR